MVGLSGFATDIYAGYAGAGFVGWLWFGSNWIY
jgi:hypothetical protein